MNDEVLQVVRIQQYLMELNLIKPWEYFQGQFDIFDPLSNDKLTGKKFQEWINISELFPDVERLSEIPENTIQKSVNEKIVDIKYHHETTQATPQNSSRNQEPP